MYLLLKDMQKEALNCYKEALEITPDDESLSAKVAELDKEVSKELEEEFISIKTEKTVDEAIVEADIFLRYGLYDNVKNLLEVYKDREPENIELHLRLKSLYVDTGDKEQAITECLILNELYKKAGDISKGEQVIKEAYEISPEDQRLISMAAPPLHEKEEEVAVTPPEGPAIEDYSEEIAEADFYSRQGLTDEARAILRKTANPLS